MSLSGNRTWVSVIHSPSAGMLRPRPAAALPACPQYGGVRPRHQSASNGNHAESRKRPKNSAFGTIVEPPKRLGAGAMLPNDAPLARLGGTRHVDRLAII